MIYEQALEIAEKVKAQLAPYCQRIEITGSIRRKEPEINKIEIVAILKPYVLIPEPYNIGLFVSGVEAVVNERTWRKVKGELPCEYMQRILPGNIKLELFFAEADNWDFAFAKRTVSTYNTHQRSSSSRRSTELKVKDSYYYKDDGNIA